MTGTDRHIRHLESTKEDSVSSKAYMEVYPKMTEKQKNIMHELYMKGENHDGHAWNMFSDIEDAVAGILKEQIASTKPDLPNISVGDMVSKEAVLDEIHKYMEERDYTIGELHDRVCEMPPAQTTLYGYSIEFLAMMAEIMKKENVGPGEALQLFKSASYIAGLVRAEWYENIQRQMDQMFAGGQDETSGDCNGHNGFDNRMREG